MKKNITENVQLKELIETVKSRREFITAGSAVALMGLGGAVGAVLYLNICFLQLPMVRLQNF